MPICDFSAGLTTGEEQRLADCRGKVLLVSLQFYTDFIRR
jgi:hypothetical protein